MNFLPVWATVWIGLLISCQPTNQTTTLNATRSPDGLATTRSSAVNYSVNDITRDTTLFAQPRQIGILMDETLTESSGLAPSQRNSGYLWTEEDSGNPNQIQLLRQDGQLVARFTIDGATNHDWEDIAVGPGPAPTERYIYIAEIGDNRLRYPEKVIYRFAEPSLAGQELPLGGHISTVETIRLQLPDGPQNAEALLVDPATNDLYILSKGDYSALYRAAFPQSVTQPTMMTRQLVMPFDRVTSAAVSTDGSEILIRTYEQVFYYIRKSGESITDALRRVPKRLPLADEPQGEAICWAVDGSGYYTTSERVDTAPQAIYFYRRKK